VNTDNLPGYHDQLGLLPYASWLAGHGFFKSLGLCLLLILGAMIVIAFIGESRGLPLFKNQFRGFFPGTVWLAIATAMLLVMAGDLPYDPRWYNSTGWHVILQIGTIIGAILMTRGDRKIYPRRALLSPTKVWNNAMYALYGYLLIAVLVAVLFGTEWSFWFCVKQAVAWFFVYLWLRRVRKDIKMRKADPETFERKAAAAHVEDWRPIWRRKKAEPVADAA
jgi:hypothetical protein